MGAPVNDVFRAIAEPTRRQILTSLAGGPRSVTDICRDFEVSQPTISAHLEVLREAGLVQVRPEGRLRLYSLDPEPLAEVSEWLKDLERFWKRKLSALGKRLDARAASASAPKSSHPSHPRSRRVS